MSAPCCTAPVPTAAVVPARIASRWATFSAASLEICLAAAFAITPADVAAAVVPPVKAAGIICGICSARNVDIKAGSETV